MGDFLEEQYRKYYSQTRHYSLRERKYAVILITDGRPGLKNGNIRVSFTFYEIKSLNCTI